MSATFGPFGGPDPPAAIFCYSRNHNGELPARHLASYAGTLQAAAYAGFGELFDAQRRPGPITEAACWSHGRRNFFELADLRKAPLAIDYMLKRWTGSPVRRACRVIGTDRTSVRYRCPSLTPNRRPLLTPLGAD
jgi:transposase